jgi:hypothetical protein
LRRHLSGAGGRVGGEVVRKIPTVFVRDEEDRRYVTDEVTPGCEWVFAGEGVPTRKYDGTCVLYDGVRWWARREVKPGKTPPEGFVIADFDEVTGKTLGWEPIEQSPFAKMHAEALTPVTPGGWSIGTYELIGPKINGNPEHAAAHALVSHAGAQVLPSEPGDPGATQAFVLSLPYEGIVWHHPDGRMAKLKRRDVRSQR